MKNIIIMVLTFLFISCLPGMSAHAVQKNDLPGSIGRNIAAEFKPESAAVKPIFNNCFSSLNHSQTFFS